jgi:outer membrane protein OmpA-like peptidoglycan-associated protein
MPVTRNITVRTRGYQRPGVQTASASGNEVVRGANATFNATGQGDCGGALTYTWTASEGTITPAAGAPQRATLDTRNVNFGPASDKDEVKQVTVTATVRDQRGGTAANAASISVRRPAELVRLPDVLFTQGSSRVNNCGKRILLEELYPKLSSGNYNIVFVGHTDEKEKTANLDRERAYSAARVLVAGGGTQVRVEPARIKADWTGTTQTAAKDPGYCGTSTRAKVTEVRGATIRQDPASENRRVEVWLVPTGVAMPPSAANAKDLPATIRPPAARRRR